jgi:hypothetical protein
MKQKYSVRAASLALAFLALAGCVTTKSTPINPANKRAATTPDQVIFYETADKVPGKYEELALLNTRADSIWRSNAAMLDSIRQSAAESGANGVILDATSEPSAGAKVASFLFFGFDIAGRKNKAVAIYVYSASAKK